MARISLKCKRCRRLQQSVCGRKNCAFVRRASVPGIHGPKFGSKITAYGGQLREKQRARALYGILEKQFRNYFKKASNQSGNIGDNLIMLLESRLDTVVLRLGFAPTQSLARQLISHGHFLVNDKKVTIPSFQVSVGDVIQPRIKSISNAYFSKLREEVNKKEPQTVGWVALDEKSLAGTVTSQPKSGEVDSPFDVKSIVEFYSK